MSSKASDRVVILDRDGTIVIDRGYLSEPDGLEFLPGAAAGLRDMHQRGYRLLVITNQSGVGRGLIPLQSLLAMNERLMRMMQQIDAPLERIYFCPHRPDEYCECRKPQLKLLTAAATELGFEPKRAVVIGDRSSDVEFGRRAGAATLLISSNGLSSDGETSTADHVVADLRAAALLLPTLQ